MPASRRIGVVTALVGAVTVLALGGCGVGDSSTVVPPPTATQNAETVEVLRRAAAEHGICYGWELSGNGSELSAGSNLGEGIRASESPMCPRWLEVTARVTYTSSSSEFEDSATVRINAHDDSISTIWLQQFDLDDKVFIDDPGWAVTRAATLLPLLAVEEGYATPAPVTTLEPAEPAAAPSNLPSAGNDFLRDRWGYLLAAFVVLALAAALMVVGLWQRGVQQRAAAQAEARRARNQAPRTGPPTTPYRRR